MNSASRSPHVRRLRRPTAALGGGPAPKFAAASYAAASFAAAKSGSTTAGGLRWQGDLAALGELLGPQGDAAAHSPSAGGPIPAILERLRAAGRLTDVKVGPRRSVHRVQVGGGTWYLKHDHPGGLWKSLAHAFGGSAARREWRGLREAARRGVPTVEPILFAETNAWRGESLLVTRGVDDAVPFDRFLAEEWPRLSASDQESVRRRLSREVGELLACLHAKGVEHQDFHGGNLLLHRSRLGLDEDDCPPFDDGRPLLTPIDLASARMRSGPLPWLVGLRHWGMIGTSLRYEGCLSDRLRALARFRTRLGERLAESPSGGWFAPPGRPARRFLTQAEAAVETNHLRWQGRHERRCCRPGRIVRAIHAPHWQGWCSQALSLREEQSLRDDVFAWLKSLADEWRDGGVRRASRMRMTAAGPQRAEFQVRIDVTTGWEPWGGPERRRWRALHRLALRRVAGPQPWLLARVPLDGVSPPPAGTPASKEWVVIEVVGAPEDRAALGALQRRLSTLHPDKRALWRARLVDAAALWAARQHDAGVGLTLPAEQALVVAVSVGKLELQLRHAAYAQFRGAYNAEDVAADLAGWFDRARPWKFSAAARRTFLKRYLHYRLLPESGWRILRRQTAQALAGGALVAQKKPLASPVPLGAAASGPSTEPFQAFAPLPTESASPAPATGEGVRGPHRRSRPSAGARTVGMDTLPPVD